MDEPLSVVGTNRARTGHRINQLFGLVDEGLFTEDDFKADGSLKEGLPRHTFGPVRPGDIKYKDLNDDGVVDSFDETAIGGTIDPQLVYGFGATVKYRQFDLGFFFQGNGEITVWLVLVRMLLFREAVTVGGLFTPITMIGGLSKIQVRMYFGLVFRVWKTRIMHSHPLGGCVI